MMMNMTLRKSKAETKVENPKAISLHVNPEKKTVQQPMDMPQMMWNMMTMFNQFAQSMNPDASGSADTFHGLNLMNPKRQKALPADEAAAETAGTAGQLAIADKPAEQEKAPSTPGPLKPVVTPPKAGGSVVGAASAPQQRNWF